MAVAPHTFNARSQICRARFSGTSVETPTKEKVLRSPGNAAKNLRSPKEKAVKFDSKSEVYRLRSLGISAKSPVTPKEKALRSPRIPTIPKEKALRFPRSVAKCLSTDNERSVKIDSKSEVYRLRFQGTSAESPTTPKEKTLRSPRTVAENWRIPKEKAVKIGSKSEVDRLKSPGTSAGTPTTHKEKDLRSPGTISNNSRTPKEKAIKIDPKSEVSRLPTRGTSAKTLSTPKIEHSKIRSSSNSSGIKRRDAAGALWSRTDHTTKVLNNKEECSSCDPISSMVSANAVDDDQLEIELAIDKWYEEALLELDLLPEGLSPLKQIISHSVASMEKSEITANSDGLFYTFDGSRFSPIEEAALVLNTSNATANVSLANVVVKETEAMIGSKHTDYLFDSWPIRHTLQGDVKNEDEGQEAVKVDSILPFQFTFKQNNDRLFCQNPFQTPILQESEITANSDGLLHTIDGSRFSPIEEAALVLNTSDATPDVLDKEAEVIIGSRHTCYLFDNWLTEDTLQVEFRNEDEGQDDVKIDSMLPLQFIPSKNNYSLLYQYPFRTPIWQRATWEETDSEIDFNYKCYAEGSLSLDSEWSVLENYNMEELYFLEQKCQDSERISSSSSLTADLEEMALGQVNLNGTSSHTFELVPSAEEFVNPDISLMHWNLYRHDHGTTAERDPSDERDPDFRSMEKFLMQLDVIFKANDELDDSSNQGDPLYWPLNPDSYPQIEGCWGDKVG